MGSHLLRRATVARISPEGDLCFDRGELALVQRPSFGLFDQVVQVEFPPVPLTSSRHGFTSNEILLRPRLRRQGPMRSANQQVVTDEAGDVGRKRGIAQ